MAEETSDASTDIVALATELTIAWLSNPNVRVAADEVPAFLKTMHATVSELSQGPASAPAETAPDYPPAVPVRSSVKPDYIVSLITGQKLKSLKRHLSAHGLTPAEYRERYGLKPDYPMVAAGYSAQRREVAQKLGLGRKGRGARGAAAAPAPAPKAAATAPAKRTRKKADAPAA